MPSPNAEVTVADPQRGRMVLWFKALHCNLKNLGLIPLATTSLCAHRQISSYLFAQITIYKMGLRTLLFLLIVLPMRSLQPW